MRSVNKKKKKTNRQKLMASVTGKYDGRDYAVDKAVLEQMRSQGGLTPKTEAQMEQIMKRMQRRSWD